jgi:ferric-dicitrate binding protein FerR (iron transport regulator)
LCQEKRQREHENALDQLRKLKLEKEKRDLDHLQELEKLQREKESLDKREQNAKTQALLFFLRAAGVG